MSRPKSVRSLLSRESKWTQGVLKNGTGSNTRYCLLGALERVYGKGEKCKKATSRLTQAIRRKFHYPVSIDNFNDHWDRTFEEIKQVIKAARI